MKVKYKAPLIASSRVIAKSFPTFKIEIYQKHLFIRKVRKV